MSARRWWARSRLGRLHRSEAGGALVELAVVLPVLILIAVGVMDYGRVYFTAVAVTNAARAGAEWGASVKGREGQTTNIQDFAKLDGAESAPITVTAQQTCKCGATAVSCATTCGAYGEPRVFVEVTATKTVALLIKYPGLPASVTVSRTASFRVQ